MMFLNKNNIAIKIILTIIISVLILTGVEHFFWDKSNSDKNYVVKVNNQKITYDQVENIFISERERQKQILGDQFFINNEQYNNQLYQAVLSQIIDEVLVEQYVKKIDVKINDNQIKQIIFSQSAFQVDGKFNNDKYLNVIRSTGLTINKYVDEIRKKLAVQKFLKTMANTEFVLDNESKDFFDLLSQKRLTNLMKIEYVNLIKTQKINQKEIEKYYYENKNSFIEKEQLLIKYVKLDIKDIKEEQVSNDEINDWYKKHISNFTKNQLNHYKIIQTKTKKEAQQLLSQLKNGKPFKEVMNSKFIDPITAYKNGDIGWLESSDLPDELKQSSSSLKNKDQFSEIIKLSTGFIILYINDIKPKYIQPLSIVKKTIINEIKKEKKINTYFNLHKQLIKFENKNEKTFLQEKIASSFTLKNTKWFYSDMFPEELNIDVVKKVIFDKIKTFNNNKTKRFNDQAILVNVNNTCSFLVYITNYKPQFLKSIDEVKQPIVNIIKNDKAKEQARNKAYKIISELKSGKSINNKYFFREQKVFSRENQDEITNTVFKLPIPEKNKNSYGIVEDTQGNIIILSLNRVYNIVLSTQQKKSIVFNIIQNNINISFSSLIQDLRKTAKIKYIKNEDI